MPSITSQAVDAKLSRAAIFPVRILAAGTQAATAVRGPCADLSAPVRGGDFQRDPGQDLSIGHPGHPGHSTTDVEPYLQERFTFRLLAAA